MIRGYDDWGVVNREAKSDLGGRKKIGSKFCINLFVLERNLNT